MSRVTLDRRVTPTLIARSTVFALGQALATMVFAPLAILALPLPYRLRYRVVIQWTFFNTWWLAITCGLRHRVVGLGNIPRAPTVVLSKHQSAWETLTLPRYFSPQVWVLKRELLRVPFFGWGLATLRPIAIDRHAGQSALEQVIAQGQRRLAEGCWVVVYPEGTRVPPGTRRRYKLGGAALAASTGAPVVPIAHNSGDFWPRNSFFKYPGEITLVIGEPLTTSGLTANEINAQAEAWIETTVAGLRQPYFDADRRPDDAPSTAG